MSFLVHQYGTRLAAWPLFCLGTLLLLCCCALQGVVVLHRGLTAYTAWSRSHFGITSWYVAADEDCACISSKPDG